MIGLLNQPHAAMGKYGFRRPVWHLSMRAAPRDKVLSDDEWAQIAGDVMNRTGLSPYGEEDDAVRWIAVRHGDDHIHIVAMLARQDRRRVRLSYERRNVRAACLAAEERYGLQSTAPADRTAPRRPSRAETAKADRRGLDEPPRITLRRHVTTAAAGARSEQEFFALLDRAGVLARQRFSAKNPGQVTGYAVALPGDTAKDGGPVWYSGGKLAPDLTWPKLRQRWTGPGTASGDAFTASERNAIWEHAARAAEDAAARIRLLAGTDPAAAADAAWAASDTLHMAAAALGSRILRQAADAYDRAARPPYARIPSPTPAGNQLRRAARLITAFAHLTKDPALTPIVLLTRLAALAEAVAGLRQAQGTPPRPPARSTRPTVCTPPQAPPPPAQTGSARPPPARQPWQAHHSRNHPGHLVRTPPPPARTGQARVPPHRPPAGVAAGSHHDRSTHRRRIMDPSGHYPDPFGEALSHSSQRVTQLTSLLAAAAEVAIRLKAARAARQAAQDEQARRVLDEQEHTARAQARARWAPAHDARWLAQADLLQAAGTWGAAAPWAGTDPAAASAMRKSEERLRTLHPFAMARYDRLRSQGASPLDAMREAAPLFGLHPHARPAPTRPPLAIDAPAADATPEPGITDGTSRQPGPEPDPYQDAERRGRRIAERLQAQALYGRGAELSPDELATALEQATSLPAEVIARLARARDEERVAEGAKRARAADLGHASAAQSARERTQDLTAARRDTQVADTADAHASSDRTAAQLAAESFPHTAADGVRAAITGRLQQPERSPARTAAVTDTRRPGLSP